MTHQMQLTHIYPTEAELWQCSDPECNRSFIRRPSDNALVTLEKGDQNVGHCCCSEPAIGVQSDATLDDVWGEVEL